MGKWIGKKSRKTTLKPEGELGRKMSERQGISERRGYPNSRGSSLAASWKPIGRLFSRPQDPGPLTTSIEWGDLISARQRTYFGLGFPPYASSGKVAAENSVCTKGEASHPYSQLGECRVEPIIREEKVTLGLKASSVNDAGKFCTCIKSNYAMYKYAELCAKIHNYAQFAHDCTQKNDRYKPWKSELVMHL